MPDLIHTLQGNDLSFLKMVAGNWGIELSAPDAYTALPQLVKGMNDRQLVLEIFESLPVEARQALQELMTHEAHLPWALFQRRYGEVRSMGPGRRDRDRPDLNPISPAEILWYRALIGRVFMNLGTEPQEYAYIPDELSMVLSNLANESTFSAGRPATPLECACPKLAEAAILDDACTMLAALRMGQPQTELADQFHLDIPPIVLRDLLICAGLLDEAGIPDPEPTRSFLEANRAASLALFVKAWMNNPVFNELRSLPGLIFEGEWQNNPLLTRQTVLDMLHLIPPDTWWNLASFIQAVHDSQPDFQRPAGDYDSWFIRKTGQTGDGNQSEYLRGFSSWFEVEGALLRFFICGPLHWLGIFDLAAPDETSSPAAFRPSAWASALWQTNPPQGLPAEDAKMTLTSDGILSAPRLAPRSARYQIARFSQWEQPRRRKGGEFDYRYRLTPSSLELARGSGLRVSHLLRLLQRHARAVPPNLAQSLERWEKFGPQVKLEQSTLLRVSSPEILEALRRTRAARYLGEVLSPTVIKIKPGGETAVQNALVEIGYLANNTEKG